MSDQVERFSVLPGGPPIWVRHTDHLAEIERLLSDEAIRRGERVLDAHEVAAPEGTDYALVKQVILAALDQEGDKDCEETNRPRSGGEMNENPIGCATDSGIEGKRLDGTESPNHVDLPEWAEDWTLGADTEPTNTSTIALRGRELAPGEHVQVVDLAEAERKIQAALTAKDEEIKRQHRLRIHAAQAHAKALAKLAEEIERQKGEVERFVAGRERWRQDAAEWQRKADANREDALANLDALEKHRRARVLANQALPAELEKMAEEFEERAIEADRRYGEADSDDMKQRHIGTEHGFDAAAARLRERAAEISSSPALDSPEVSDA